MLLIASAAMPQSYLSNQLLCLSENRDQKKRRPSPHLPCRLVKDAVIQFAFCIVKVIVDLQASKTKQGLSHSVKVFVLLALDCKISQQPVNYAL